MKTASQPQQPGDATVHKGSSASSAGTRRKHIAALDGLRGVAIIGVLLFHAGHLRGGFLGVDLFFALSGYLITDLLLREVAATGTVSLPSFWARRLRRLLPALAVVLVGTTLLVWALGTPAERSLALSDGPWVQANLVNWHLIAESAGYWDRFGPARVFGHLWSIAIEEQFYLVWPVVLVLLARGRRALGTRLALVAGLASVVSLALMALLVNPADPTRVYTGTDTRAFSLLLGALAASPPVRQWISFLRGRANLVLVPLLVGLLLSWFVVDGTGSASLFQGGLFLHSLVSALVVALCAQAPDAPVSRLLGVSPVRWIGEISYSLYLWHWPIFVLLTEDRLGFGGWPRTAVLLAVSLVAAAVSKRVVEDPIRFRAAWARGRSGLAALTAVMVALAALWVAVPRPSASAIDTSALGSTATRGRPGSGPSKALLLGDSIAEAEEPALTAAMRASGVTLESAAAAGGGGVVGPIAGMTWETLPGQLSSSRPDLVVYQITTYDWGAEAEQRAGYERLVRAVSDVGATLVFVTHPPIREGESFYAPHLAELNRAPAVARQVAASSGGRAHFLDASAVWGTRFQLDGNGDGKPERSKDGIHVCPMGAASFASWLMNELTRITPGLTPAPASAWANTGWADDARFGKLSCS
ncbi:Peptidoglycan/LPS O-acetylase OafA/YrhL, contains acyltransferase and SGNH-hydrolase domains [Streptoalloteichus tenebrarius]|uniref:Peptidoglycan/LPS O-acetylase OafA/YrhL, contains acyltransferase and SGNH-hydrolase domains n=1 Tax=Streptoalloteichus tenebrarius (strain ATCC 17920 / DSM 40477 / JCM 4838 / CBS 697.72 / NBRC 16177 / NCIMB 11028 / NRRL B-12390 / A12253. 1 / ISP 5477) TaxID=1933 RepID=A0ABT1HWB4_STRSD|nr:acyltransferase family protein [Streptoalloteichus tenebrarius]MCP2259804.1 Peptidoglycan/LPS O-acetylase OafA/YrhL, contains acyltransferase and SGNH-hydrolase domains [Streptoalloteichus tenebrarius]BFE99250.1 hypothetical protein GCM10020241_09260 [Streptoalloteichus tenebrarius]